MKIPDKISFSRIIIAVIIMIILLFPFDSAGITTYKIFINETIVVDIKYLIVAALFIIASITDFLDGYYAKKHNCSTDFGKMIDAIADKILVDSVLIIFAGYGSISLFVPVIIIARDIIVDAIKLSVAKEGGQQAAIMSGKIKTASLMIGMVLTFFYNLPFELIGLPVADILLIGAVVLSVISGCQYFYGVRDILFPKKKAK